MEKSEIVATLRHYAATPWDQCPANVLLAAAEMLSKEQRIFQRINQSTPERRSQTGVQGKKKPAA